MKNNIKLGLLAVVLCVVTIFSASCAPQTEPTPTPDTSLGDETVYPENGAKKIYTVIVTRKQDPNYKPSGNSLLSGIPALKMGPGDTARSHTANEYVLISEIRDGIEKFSAMLDGLKL